MWGNVKRMTERHRSPQTWGQILCCQRQHVAGVEASESNPGGTTGGLFLVTAPEIQTAEARLVHRLMMEPSR